MCERDKFVLFKMFEFGDNSSCSAVVFSSDAVYAVKDYVIGGVVRQFQGRLH